MTSVTYGVTYRLHLNLIRKTGHDRSVWVSCGNNRMKTEYFLHFLITSHYMWWGSKQTLLVGGGRSHQWCSHVFFTPLISSYHDSMTVFPVCRMLPLWRHKTHTALSLVLLLYLCLPSSIGGRWRSDLFQLITHWKCMLGRSHVVQGKHALPRHKQPRAPLMLANRTNLWLWK